MSKEITLEDVARFVLLKELEEDIAKRKITLDKRAKA